MFPVGLREISKTLSMELLSMRSESYKVFFVDVYVDLLFAYTTMNHSKLFKSFVIRR